jgi:diadenylate cyclase
MNGMLGFFAELWKPALEIAIIFLVIYAALRFIQGTRGEGVLKGFAIILLFVFFLLWSVSSAVELDAIQFLLSRFLEVTIFALLIIFQPELRHVLVRISQTSIFGRQQLSESVMLDEIKRAVLMMSKMKIGALIVLGREVGLRSFIEKGSKLDAEVKAELLESIFYPGSALHDGAVIIQEQRIAAAGCLLPLSENPEIGKTVGTRHRAGIGLTEETDAITVIVSEETGGISVGVNGALYRNLDAGGLDRLLDDLYLKYKEPGSLPEAVDA